jgi:hypothetical protein
MADLVINGIDSRFTGRHLWGIYATAAIGGTGALWLNPESMPSMAIYAIYAVYGRLWPSMGLGKGRP